MTIEKPAPPNETDTHKADFSAIYTAPDPRRYFRTLLPLEYQIPQLATPVIERVLDAAFTDRPDGAVLDLCCSYGITSAMLSAPDGPEAAAERYADPRLEDLTTTGLAEADRDYYERHPRLGRVVGLDVSDAGVGYARSAGLLDDGWVEDLEHDEPSAGLAAGIRDVGVIVCTGGYGYIGPDTFERILRSAEHPERLWLVVFVLRVFDYAPTAALLAQHGLVTESLPGTFRQRRFADAEEQRAAIDDVRRRGLDPTGLESDGWFHANCFVTHPATQTPPTSLSATAGRRSAKVER